MSIIDHFASSIKEVFYFRPLHAMMRAREQEIGRVQKEAANLFLEDADFSQFLIHMNKNELALEDVCKINASDEKKPETIGQYLLKEILTTKTKFPARVDYLLMRGVDIEDGLSLAAGSPNVSSLGYYLFHRKPSTDNIHAGNEKALRSAVAAGNYLAGNLLMDCDDAPSRWNYAGIADALKTLGSQLARNDFVPLWGKREDARLFYDRIAGLMVDHTSCKTRITIRPGAYRMSTDDLIP